jgi:hypothetical protein
MIINAIRSEKVTLEEIEQTLPQLKTNSIKFILNKLRTEGVIVFEESGAIALVKRDATLRLGGDLNLPVSTFIDANNQRFVIRGRWHPIPDDLDITTIEWFDDMPQQISIHEKVQKKRQQQAETKKKDNFVEEDGPAATDDLSMCGRWVDIDDKYKVWVIAVSAKRASVEISPRYYNENVEMPYGSCCLKQIISVEDARAISVSHTKSIKEIGIVWEERLFLDKYPNVFPIAFKDGGITYLSVKGVSDAGYRVVEYLISKKNGKNTHSEIQKLTLPHANYNAYILSKCELFANALKQILE